MQRKSVSYHSSSARRIAAYPQQPKPSRPSLQSGNSEKLFHRNDNSPVFPALELESLGTTSTSKDQDVGRSTAAVQPQEMWEIRG